jgi:hypothetical protein
VTSPDPADPPARSVHLPTSAARWLSVVTSGEHDEQISTEHLLLVPLRASDAEELAGLLEDPLVRDWLGADDVSGLRDRFSGWESRLSPDATELWLNWIVRVGAARRAAAWVQATVHDETATVAYCVLGWRPRLYERPSTGYTSGWGWCRSPPTSTAPTEPVDESRSLPGSRRPNAGLARRSSGRSISSRDRAAAIGPSGVGTS